MLRLPPFTLPLELGGRRGPVVTRYDHARSVRGVAWAEWGLASRGQSGALRPCVAYI